LHDSQQILRLGGAVLFAACLPATAGAGPNSGAAADVGRAARASAAENKAKAERLAQQRAARRADPMSWVRTLNPMATGGWEFRGVAADGSWAILQHRSPDEALRAHDHAVAAAGISRGAEEQRRRSILEQRRKVQFDCGKDRQRLLIVIYYSENNISGSQQQEENDPKNAPWQAVVPGTQSESVFQWACSGSRGK
jgi:hypothetical protein